VRSCRQDPWSGNPVRSGLFAHLDVGHPLTFLRVDVQPMHAPTTLIGELINNAKRAIVRGEVRPDVDPALVLDTLAGVIDYRLLFWRMPLSTDLATQLVDLVMPGIRAVDAPAGSV
jgi:hypothetical protein